MIARALLWLLVLLAASAPASPQPRPPHELVLLSTTDVKGKTSPCG